MKNLILFLSLFFTVQIGTAQETWNACNSTVSQVPQPAYDSTFVLSAPSRAALAKGMANWEPARSYKVYTALLTQSGTDAPVATVLENTLGFTPTYSYEAVGAYNINHTGGFPAAKTFTYISPTTDNGGFDAFISGGLDDFISISTINGDNGLINNRIEIRVYP
jgi:hypothetical protein